VIGTDEFPSYLQHPQHGLVWYVWGGSRAHGHQRFNCRCHITAEFDLSDLLYKVGLWRTQLISRLDDEALLEMET
jgi:hypothetical protein